MSRPHMPVSANDPFDAAIVPTLLIFTVVRPGGLSHDSSLYLSCTRYSEVQSLNSRNVANVERTSSKMVGRAGIEPATT